MRDGAGRLNARKGEYEQQEIEEPSCVGRADLMFYFFYAV
jgi:hypothetical protein